MKRRHGLPAALLVAGLTAAAGWSCAPASASRSRPTLPPTPAATGGFLPLLVSRAHAPWLHGGPSPGAAGLAAGDILWYPVSPTLSLQIRGQQIALAGTNARFADDTYAYELRYTPSPGLALHLARIEGGQGEVEGGFHYAPGHRLAIHTWLRSGPAAVSARSQIVYRPAADAAVRLDLARRTEEAAEHASVDLRMETRWQSLRLSLGYYVWEVRRPGALESGTFQSVQIGEDRGAWRWWTDFNSHETRLHVGARRGPAHVTLSVAGNPFAYTIAVWRPF